MSEIRTKVALGAAWILAARISVNLIGLLSTITLARLLLPSDFGIVAIAGTVIAIIDSFTNVRVANALVRTEAPTRGHIDTVWTICVIRGLLLAGIIGLCAFPAAIIFKEKNLTNVLLVLASANIITGMYNPKLSILNKNLIFSRDFAINVSSKTLGLLAAAFVAWQYKSYWALVVGSVIAQFVTLIVGYALEPYRPRLTLSHWNDIFSFSAWLSLSQTVIAMNTNFDQLIAGANFNHATVGSYSFANNLAALPTREAIAPVSSILFPAFTQLSKDPERTSRAYLRSIAVICGIAFPAAAGFAFVAPQLIPLVVGAKWAVAAQFISAIALLYGVGSLSTAVQALVMSTGNTRDLFYRELILLLVNIPLFIFGVIFGGIWGLIGAKAISTLVATFVDLQLAARTIRISMADQLTCIARYLTTSLIMWVALNEASQLVQLIDPARGVGYLAICAALGAAIYIATTLACWVFMKRPVGLETEIMTFAERLGRRN